MVAAQRGGQSLVITSEPAKPGRPAEGAFHDPAAWEQDEAVLGLVVLDHFQADAVLRRILPRSFAGVALVHPRQGTADLITDSQTKDFCWGFLSTEDTEITEY